LKSNRKIVIVLMLAFVLSAIAMPAIASNPEPYPCSSPTEYEGLWSTQYNYGIETYETNTYRLLLVFTIYNVETDADDYYVEIDYKGVDPGYFWNYETLDVLYRWGMSGSWTHLYYFNNVAIHDTYDVTTATSSIFQIRFIDYVRDGDQTQHTWSFGARPILWAYWG
jgi:hypothetical protein